jgi:hypothetical protein
MVDIIRLEGEDRQLYDWVAHLVMNEDVLNYNLNYPYRTSSRYVWFVAVDQGHTLGFMPVKLGAGKAKINNYYVVDDDGEVFSALLKKIVMTFPTDCELESITQLRHVPDFEKNGFAVALYWKRYAKMKAIRNEEKCV